MTLNIKFSFKSLGLRERDQKNSKPFFALNWLYAMIKGNNQRNCSQVLMRTFLNDSQIFTMRRNNKSW